MSSNQWVNQAIGVVAGIVVGVFTYGTASFQTYAAIAGIATYSITTMAANSIGGVGRPRSVSQRPPAFAKPSSYTARDAVAQTLNINSASEAVVIPTIFGRCRVNPNNTRWDISTFRKVPIIERIEKESSDVAYRMAQDVYKKNPSKVNHELDEQAKKRGSSSGGGKGGGSNKSSPPPSQQYSDSEKIGTYTQLLLDKDASGKSKLPKEYNEFTTGFKYYLTWEVGICMGPISEFYAVWMMPGNKVVMDRSSTPVSPAPNYVVTLQGGEQGGNVLFYNGQNDQTRNPADPYANEFTNYRGVCIAVFTDFYIGLSSTPPSYLFDLARYPVCHDANGDLIPGFYDRACLSSDTNTHPAAMDANPAAILWEIMTNKQWGKGLDPNLLDTDSFVSASLYFATNEIGMSFMLDSPTLIQDALDQIRSHVQTMLVWAGGKLYCRCLMDRSTAYTPMITLTMDKLRDVIVTRPTWVLCPNELRVTFLHRTPGFVNEVAVVQDLAGIGAQGVINSSDIQLPCFSLRKVAETMGKRLLLESSYPAANMSAVMNHMESHIIPGDFVRIISNEWADGPLTTYWRMVDMSDEGQEGGISIKLVEDIYSTGTEGPPTTFTPAVPAWEGTTTNSASDLYIGDDQTAPYDDLDLVVQTREMPITLTDSDRILCFLAQRGNPKTTSLRIFWRDTLLGGDYSLLGEIAPWAITGTVVGTIQPDPVVTRNANFELILDNPDELGRFLEFCSLCPTPSDSIQQVTGGETNFLIIDNEIMQVAYAEAGSEPDRVLIKAVVRGRYGTEPAPHYDGTPFGFMYEMIPRVFTLRYDPMPFARDIDLRVVPVDGFGVAGTPHDSILYIFGRARWPLKVLNWGLNFDFETGEWIVTFRGRFHNRGAEFISDIEGDLNTLAVAIPDGFEFYVRPLNLEDVPLTPSPVKCEVTFTPETLDGAPGGGMCQISYIPPAGTEKLRLYTAYIGVLSEEFTTIS